MPEVSAAVTEAFHQHQGTDVFESNRSVVTFITEGLLTHFFCYFEKLERSNISWFLEYINKQNHLLRVQLPQHNNALQLSLSSRSSSEEVDLPFLPYYNTDFNMLKYFLLKILGSCSEVKQEDRKQWISPYETEVRYTVFE